MSAEVSPGVLAESELVIWYDQPAVRWPDALPIANGRLGAMVYGGVRAERLLLSESTFWSGEPSTDNHAPGTPEAIAEVRRLLQAGDMAAAEALAQQAVGRKLNYGTNLPFGNLQIVMSHGYDGLRDYRRALDLDSGVATVTYRAGGIGYRREAIASHPDGVLVLRLSCDRAAALSLRVGLDGDEQPYSVASAGIDTLLLDVGARETIHSDGRTGVSGHARLRAIVEGGAVSASGDHLLVEGADAVVLLLAASTSFGGDQAAAECAERISAAGNQSFAGLCDRAVANHQQFFRRAGLDLGPPPHPDWPLDRRLSAVRGGADDPHLYALLFQFGRYLLIGSSRPDSPLPADLQGAWNDNVACRIGWTCDFHLDINTQMNYWIAELTGLGDCVAPLFRWITETLVPSGRHTAVTAYALPGWVAHTVANAWGYSAAGWSTHWGVFPTAGVWIATHLWEHYLFTGDVEFLRTSAYPVLREAAEFFLGYLMEDHASGWLLTGPACSPENAFQSGEGRYTLTLAPTVDRILLDELFTEVIEGSQVLAVDAELRERLRTARAKLPPYQVGAQGQLQEWLHDYAEALPHHRHTSHLLGLYPYAQITPEHTPALAEAARRTIENRLAAPGGFEEGAWARNNFTLFYARLGDAAQAHDSLQTLLVKGSQASLMVGTRLAPFDAYELDYNTGASAGIAEMLLQSHAGRIALLPALPDAWSEGEVRGLRARGGFEVDMSWRGGRLGEARLRSHRGGLCRLNAPQRLSVWGADGRIRATPVGEQSIEFETEPEAEYVLRPA